MRIPARICSAIHALVDLACFGHLDKPIQLIQIAQRIEMSHSYLEQIFMDLRKANLVKSHRGPGGGYTLAKSAELINLKEIVLVFDQNSKVTDDIKNLCMALDAHMTQYMETITLAMVVNRNLEKITSHKIVKMSEISRETLLKQKLLNTYLISKNLKRKSLSNSVFAWAAQFNLKEDVK